MGKLTTAHLPSQNRGASASAGTLDPDAYVHGGDHGRDMVPVHT